MTCRGTGLRSAAILLALLAVATLPPSAAPAPDDDDRPLDARTYSQGLEALRAGRRDDAGRLLRRVFTDFPESPHAPPALLKVAEMIYPAAAWDQVGSASPQAVQQAGELLSRLAQKYRASHEASRALLLLGYLGLEPANPAADLDAACGRFATATQIYPDGDAVDEALFASGMCDILGSRPARAADLFSRLLEEHPESPLAAESLYRHGVALSWLDDPAEAMLVLQALRARHPDSPLAAKALDRMTLLHRLRVTPVLARQAAGGREAAPKPAAPAPAGGLDWVNLYRADTDYGATTGAASAAAMRGVSDISIDAQGLAVVASPRTPGVFRLDARGRVQEQIQHPGPDHVAAGAGLAVFISGREQIAVNARNWSGVDLKGASGRPPGDFGPIAVDSIGRVHLLDRRENAVLIYDRTRRLIGAVRPPAGKEGRFVDVAAGSESGIYVLDGRARMVVALHQGRETRRTNLSALGSAEPVALAVDGLGDLYVLDGATGAVFVTDPTGRLITIVRPPRDMMQRIGTPEAVAVDASGRIYLGGRKGGAVLRLQ